MQLSIASALKEKATAVELCIQGWSLTAKSGLLLVFTGEKVTVVFSTYLLHMSSLLYMVGLCILKIFFSLFLLLLLCIWVFCMHICLYTML